MYTNCTLRCVKYTHGHADFYKKQISTSCFQRKCVEWLKMNDLSWMNQLKLQPLMNALVNRLVFDDCDHILFAIHAFESLKYKWDIKI